VRYAVGGRAIFDGLNLTARRGRITAFMGPSGTGKTTLLRLITGQIYAERGSVRVFGDEVSTMTGRQLFALRQRMGMLFQNGALLTDEDVYENVAFPVRAHTRLPEPLIRQLVLTKLHAVGLRGAARLMPAELSGGMQRRVALARAIVMDPDIRFFLPLGTARLTFNADPSAPAAWNALYGSQLLFGLGWLAIPWTTLK